MECHGKSLRSCCHHYEVLFEKYMKGIKLNEEKKHNKNVYKY